jgi:hypothetical protein
MISKNHMTWRINQSSVAVYLRNQPDKLRFLTQFSDACKKIPGQSLKLHSIDSELASPSFRHSLSDSLLSVQKAVLVFLPSPHVTLHGDHSDQTLWTETKWVRNPLNRTFRPIIKGDFCTFVTLEHYVPRADRERTVLTHGSLIAILTFRPFSLESPLSQCPINEFTYNPEKWPDVPCP